MAAQTAQQILFQQSLPDVVRQLRNNKTKEKETIQSCIADIKSELNSSAQNVKVTAVVKLTYFSMLGYSGDYGAFNIIEVMADPSFNNKRVGYVAAAVCFHESTAVLPLITALLKRDLSSANHYEIGMALYCLSCVCNTDLARDLVSDVVNLLSHHRPYVRKKAVLCLYKIFLQFPDALRPTYPKLKEKLEDGNEKADNDPAVRGAVVNILCEMARRNPGNFLNFVVPFFALLSTVHNNWTLIKVIKVFGYFAPLEPRLGKKLVEPITNLINTSGAKSVQYECIAAVANGMSKVTSLTRLATERMRFFVEDHDQNLKYLGLDAMTKVMVENPKALAENRDLILGCLDDPDATIRLKALQLLQGMATKKNIVSTISAMFDRLVRFPPDEEWSNTVIKSICEVARAEDYSNVQDFEWYCSILLDLAQVNLTHFKHGALIENELVAISTRVRAIRQYAIESLSSLLTKEDLLSCNAEDSTQWMVLKAAAFLCGEFPHWIPNKTATVKHLISDRVASLPAELQVVCLSAAGKIHSYCAHPCQRHLTRADGEEELEEPEDSTTVADIVAVLNPPTKDGHISGLPLFCQSVYPDVQERALLVNYLVGPGAEVAHFFYDAELEAVAEDAQEAVGLPEGLDLDSAFADMPSLVENSESGDSDSDGDGSSDSEVERSREAQLEALRRKEKARRNEVDAFYIRDGSGSRPAEEELPPVEVLEPQGSKRAKPTGRKAQTISRALSKPAAYVNPSKKPVVQDVEDEATKKLKGINLTKQLDATEVLPVAQPYRRTEAEATPAHSAVHSVVGSPRGSDQLVGLDDDAVKVSFNVVECKAKKEGFVLTCQVTVVNKLEKHSLYEPTLVTSADGNCRIVDGPAEGVAAVPVAPRIKGTAAASCELHLLVPTPLNFDTPAMLQLKSVKDKKEELADVAVAFPLRCFMKAVEKIDSAEFNSKILQSLADSASLSATLDVGSKKKLLPLLDAAQQSLRLALVDTYKDSVALCGQLVSRKNTASQAYVAIVVVASANGEQVSLYAKCQQQSVAAQVIQELAQVVV